MVVMTKGTGVGQIFDMNIIFPIRGLSILLAVTAETEFYTLDFRGYFPRFRDRIVAF